MTSSGEYKGRVGDARPFALEGGGGRALFVVHSEYPLREVRVQRQALAAVQAGWQVDVLALSYASRPAGLEVVDGVRVIHSPVRRLRMYSAAGLLREYVPFAWYTFRHCVKGPAYDVVVVANPPDFLLHASLPLRHRGAKLVFDVHDFSTDLFDVRLQGATRRIATPALRLLEVSALRLADHVVTVHRPYADEVERRTRGRVRATVVMNSADPRLFQVRTTSPSHDRPVVMYHGTLAERYGVTDLLWAFASVCATSAEPLLWLLGGGDARDALKEQARGFDISDRVVVPSDWVSVEEVAAQVQRATLGIIPNRPNRLNRFALSTKLFEYVASGVPVVCAGLPTLRSHFGDQELLFYRAGDREDLARTLRWALEHPEQMEARATRALARYESEYAWPAQRDRFMDVLESMRRGK